MKAFVFFRVAQEVLKFPDAPEDVAMHKKKRRYLSVFRVGYGLNIQSGMRILELHALVCGFAYDQA